MATLAVCLLLAAHSARADTAEITWTGSTSGVWNDPTNWTTSGTTSSGTSAVFNTGTAYANQPALTAATTAEGLWDTGNSGGVTTTVSGSNLVITGNATLDGIANAGILLDGAGNNSLTTATGLVTISNSTNFLVNNGGTLTISTGLNLNGKTLTLGSTTSSGSGSIVISGSIAGANSALNINDTAGTTSVTLAGTDTFTGTVTLTAGTLNINSVAALGVPASGSYPRLVINGGTIDNTSGTSVTTGNGSETWGGDFTYQGSNSLNLGTGGATLTANRVVTVNSNTLSIGGIIGDSSGGFSLTKAGVGTLALGSAGTNTYSGGLFVNSGTILASNSASAGTGPLTLGSASGGSAAYILAGSAGLTLTNAINLAAGDISGTIILGNTINGSPANATGAIALNGDNLTISDLGTNTFSIKGNISGNGNIITSIAGGVGIAMSGTINNSGTIINNGSGSGGTLTISGTLGSNVQSIVQNSLTSLIVLTGSNNAYGGSLAIQSGTMEVSANDTYSGTGTIILGSAGNAPSSFLSIVGGTVMNALITTATGATGTLTLGNASTSTAIYNGAIVLAFGDTLTLSSVASLDIFGGITGTGNLITATGTASNIVLGSSIVNNNGTITNSGAGIGSLVITAGVGSNVTAITESSATSGLAISSTLGTSALTVNGNGTTLTNNGVGAKTLSVTGTGGIDGTGNLVLNNNSAIAGGISIATNINNSGTLINSGIGTGSTLISGTIGTNVQGVVQNSATSALTLSAIDTYTGATTITAGTLLLSGTGSITKSSTIAVNAGATFDISGITAGSYTIGTTQTLTGGGTVNGGANLLHVAGTLNPGAGTGTGQTLGVTGAMTLMSTANTALTMYAATNDGVTASGLLTYAGSLTVSLSGLTAGTYNYTLFSGGGTAGDFSSVIIAGVSLTGSGNVWTGNVVNNGITFAATFTDPDSSSASTATLNLVSAVPEPSAMLLVLAGAGALIAMRHLRRGRKPAQS